MQAAIVLRSNQSSVIDKETQEMTNQLMRIGAQGFSFDAVAGWHLKSNGANGELVLYLYISGMSEPILFYAKEAKAVQQLLEAGSLNITPPTPL